MQLDYLQKILGHVKKGLTCPRCQVVFGSAEINILAIRDRNIDLSIKCPHCETEARISAQVTTHKAKITRPESITKETISTTTHVTPENVEDLRRTISGLSASDIDGLGTK